MVPNPDVEIIERHLSEKSDNDKKLGIIHKKTDGKLIRILDISVSKREHRAFNNCFYDENGKVNILGFIQIGRHSSNLQHLLDSLDWNNVTVLHNILDGEWVWFWYDNDKRDWIYELEGERDISSNDFNMSGLPLNSMNIQEAYLFKHNNNNELFYVVSCRRRSRQWIKNSDIGDGGSGDGSSVKSLDTYKIKDRLNFKGVYLNGSIIVYDHQLMIEIL